VLGFDSVDELNSLNHVVEELEAVEQPLSLGRGLHELVDHREARRALGAAAWIEVTIRGLNLLGRPVPGSSGI
jgi:hypothetical protein